MSPRTPVVPMLRSPGARGSDHQVRVDGRPCCGAKVDPDTWTVIPANLARNRCEQCERETK